MRARYYYIKDHNTRHYEDRIKEDEYEMKKSELLEKGNEKDCQLTNETFIYGLGNERIKQERTILRYNPKHLECLVKETY